MASAIMNFSHHHHHHHHSSHPPPSSPSINTSANQQQASAAVAASSAARQSCAIQQQQQHQMMLDVGGGGGVTASNVSCWPSVGNLVQQPNHQVIAAVQPAAMQPGIRMGGTLEDLEAAYKIYGKLGSGGYGQVYRGVRHSDKFPVAVKVVEKKRVPAWCEVNGHRVPNEVSLHARVHHLQGIVAMLDHYKLPDGNHVLVMERPDPVMDLFDFITYNGALDETVARVFFRQLVHTVIRCHGHGVVHRDIKDENVLINVKTGQLYLIDFGSSAQMQTACYEKFDAGTRVYCPPEWVRHELFHPVYGTTWSLGVLLYDMLCGDIPFENEPQIIAGHLSWERVGSASTVSAVAKDLVRRLLTGTMEHRLTLEEVLLHPWMQSPLPVYAGVAVPTAVAVASVQTSAADAVDSSTHQQQHAALMTEASAFDYNFRVYAAKAIKKHQRKTGVKLLEQNITMENNSNMMLVDQQQQQQQQQFNTTVSAPLFTQQQQHQHQYQQQQQQLQYQEMGEISNIMNDLQQQSVPTPPQQQPHFVIGDDDDDFIGGPQQQQDSSSISMQHHAEQHVLPAQAQQQQMQQQQQTAPEQQLLASFEQHQQQQQQQQAMLQRLSDVNSILSSSTFDNNNNSSSVVSSSSSTIVSSATGAGGDQFMSASPTMSHASSQVALHHQQAPSSSASLQQHMNNKCKQTTSGYNSLMDNGSYILSPEVVGHSKLPPTFLVIQQQQQQQQLPHHNIVGSYIRAHSEIVGGGAGATGDLMNRFVPTTPLLQQRQQLIQQHLVPTTSQNVVVWQHQPAIAARQVQQPMVHFTNSPVHLQHQHHRQHFMPPASPLFAGAHLQQNSNNNNNGASSRAYSVSSDNEDSSSLSSSTSCTPNSVHHATVQQCHQHQQQHLLQQQQKSQQQQQHLSPSHSFYDLRALEQLNSSSSPPHHHDTVDAAAALTALPVLLAASSSEHQSFSAAAAASSSSSDAATSSFIAKLLNESHSPSPMLVHRPHQIMLTTTTAAPTTTSNTMTPNHFQLQQGSASSNCAMLIDSVLDDHSFINNGGAGCSSSSCSDNAVFAAPLSPSATVPNVRQLLNNHKGDGFHLPLNGMEQQKQQQQLLLAQHRFLGHQHQHHQQNPQQNFQHHIRIHQQLQLQQQQQQQHLQQQPVQLALSSAIHPFPHPLTTLYHLPHNNNNNNNNNSLQFVHFDSQPHFYADLQQQQQQQLIMQQQQQHQFVMPITTATSTTTTTIPAAIMMRTGGGGGSPSSSSSSAVKPPIVATPPILAAVAMPILLHHNHNPLRKIDSGISLSSSHMNASTEASPVL